MKKSLFLSGVFGVAMAMLVIVSVEASPVFEVAVHSITATEGDGPLSLCVNVTAGKPRRYLVFF